MPRNKGSLFFPPEYKVIARKWNGFAFQWIATQSEILLMINEPLCKTHICTFKQLHIKQ